MKDRHERRNLMTYHDNLYLNQSYSSIKTPTIKVNIVESERGWGRNILDIKEFATLNKALEFIQKYNKDLKPGPAPDYYIQAELA